MDFGSSTCKVGFAGKDTPQSVFPSAIGTIEGSDSMEVCDDRSSSSAKRRMLIGQQAISFRRDNMEIAHPIKDGLVQDWEAMEQLLSHTYSQCLFVESKEHPVISVDPVMNTRAARERHVQLMFEKFESPAVFLASSAVLNAFATGRTTALVLDSGSSVTTCVPVFEGFKLQKGTRRTRFAGDLLDSVLESVLLQHAQSASAASSTSNDIPLLTPKFLLKKTYDDQLHRFNVASLSFPGTRDSFTRFMKMDLVRDIKENVCRASEYAVDARAEMSSWPGVAYELPDGRTIDIGGDRFAVSELMFQPTFLDVSSFMSSDIDASYQFQGVTKMVQDSINVCDVDIRRELFGNIIPVGGTSMLQGFNERLQRQLAGSVASAIKVRVQASTTSIERQYGAWVGGSILASLGSFQQMWFSKQEYQEYGASLIDRKCP
jgi:actin-like protein 6A